MESDVLFTIGQLARQVGLSVRTIRFWSDEGVLPVRKRSAAGYRLYDLSAVVRLELVKTLRELGLGLEAIADLLRERTTIAEIAEAHALALDQHIATLLWQRSVLKLVAGRRATIEETQIMHAYAKLSASERQAMLDDFVQRALEGVPAEHPASRIGAAMRLLPAELPAEPKTEQVEAWVELAHLISDPSFAARVREMAISAPADPSGPMIQPDQVQGLVSPALARGVDPATAEGQRILEQLLPRDLDADGASRLRQQLETFTDERVERYWHLHAVLHERAPQAPMVPAFRWVIAAIAARERAAQP